MSQGCNIENDDDYYTFLNLPKNATNEQINTAYRKLSRIYHPDKHADPGNKLKAETLFNRTKRAYEVLSDPHKRAIYDSLGEKGLRTEGWELVYHSKSPAEIRQEFERLSREAEERKLQQRTNPKGNVTVNINATEIFSAYDETELPHIEIAAMSISQSIDAPITVKNTITLNGNLTSSNGNGSGNFVVSGRRLLNKAWLEIDIGAGHGPIVGLKGGRSLSSLLTLNGGTTLNFRENVIIPSLFSTLAVQLDKHTVGSMTLNSSTQSAMTTQVDCNLERYAWSTSFVIGSPHIFFTIAYTRKMIENELKLKVAAKIGTFGFLAEYGAEKKISKYSSLFAAVSIGVPTGVILKLKFIRANQSYIFPIQLSEEIVPAAIFYASVIPPLLWLILKKTVIDPMIEERQNIEFERNKRNNEQRLQKKKGEAQAAVDLMKPTYERIISEEVRQHGLIIKTAIYGNIEKKSGSFQSNASIDVTIPLQCLVKNGALELYNGSKSELPGFYDPCIGLEKYLKIEYTLNNEQNIILVKDSEPVRLL